MPPKAHRCAGKRNDLAHLSGSGAHPQDAGRRGDRYRDVGQTALGHESPEQQRQLTRTFDEFIAMLERDLPRG